MQYPQLLTSSFFVHNLPGQSKCVKYKPSNPYMLPPLLALMTCE